MIRMNEIKKTYHMGSVQQAVLDGVDVTIKEGEMTALMGASGSGKTTLLNIMGLLDEADEGEYFLNNRDVTKSNAKEKAQIRSHEIGFVFQNFHLIPELTAFENVRMAMDIYSLYTKKKMPKKEKTDRCREMLGKVGLEKEETKKPAQLSGGQKQRVAIARALVNRPRIILADEPTGALDQTTSGEIMELLSDLNKEGHTILIVTHDEEVAGKCGRIIKMQNITAK